jgi:glutaminase
MKPCNIIICAAALITATLAINPVSAQRRSPVAPRDEQVKAVLNEAYSKFNNDTSGKNADYIPYLAKVDPKLLE